jgi:hypothetical protein
VTRIRRRAARPGWLARRRDRVVEVARIDAGVAPDEGAPGDRGVGPRERLDDLDLLHRRDLRAAPDPGHVHAHDARGANLCDDVIGQAPEPVVLGRQVFAAHALRKCSGVLEDLMLVQREHADVYVGRQHEVLSERSRIKQRTMD